jgi:hypothetical protein
MFAHPRCTCTRASLSELTQLMERGRDRMQAAVVFMVPRGASEDWTKTDLWASAARIPGVTVLRDAGEEAARFGAATSGSVVLYGADGSLLFHGGITPSRGHEGDSFGRERILAFLTTGKADRADAPVFGCALQDDGQAVRVASGATEETEKESR